MQARMSNAGMVGVAMGAGANTPRIILYISFIPEKVASVAESPEVERNYVPSWIAGLVFTTHAFHIWQVTHNIHSRWKRRHRHS